MKQSLLVASLLISCGLLSGCLKGCKKEGEEKKIEIEVTKPQSDAGAKGGEQQHFSYQEEHTGSGETHQVAAASEAPHLGTLPSAKETHHDEAQRDETSHDEVRSEEGHHTDHAVEAPVAPGHGA